MKNVGGAITTYVYDAQGQLAAEYGAATDSGTSYLTADHLGSTRLATDATGAVKKCYDYYPFGEDIAPGTGGRSSCFADGIYPSNPDVFADKFTGKERDSESGLDFFGARYFSAPQGRFTSPDEFKGGIVDPFTGQDIATNNALPYSDITDPQTLNKYAYVRNNPLRYVDPDGHGDVDTLVKHAFDIIGTFEQGAEAAASNGIGLLGNAAGAVAGIVLNPGTPLELFSRASYRRAIQSQSATYPHVRFLLPHLGEYRSDTWWGHMEALDLVRRYPNVYVDTSGIGSMKYLEMAVRELPPERILFATFAPELDPSGHGDHPADEAAAQTAREGDGWQPPGTARGAQLAPSRSRRDRAV